MKRMNLILLITALIIVSIAHGGSFLFKDKIEDKSIKVGFLYVGDSCNTYTNNFIRAQNAVEQKYGDSVEIYAKYNVSEGNESKYLQELVDDGCNLIFATSFGYGDATKEIAEKYPDVEFCSATCANANEDPVLPNFHNFMGEIYQGRYIAGVVAGMKLQEMIDQGEITADQAKIGYVGAFPYAEVISGYTAFFLGVRSIVPEATMTVGYTNSWGDYAIEKEMAEQMIQEGCVIISQHSDTMGPAVACEEMSSDYPVYHVGYNQSMMEIAPTTSLISCRINWQYYIVAATGAVLDGKDIEESVEGHVHGNDVSAGFDYDWVEMLKLNTTIAADGTQEKMDELIEEFQKNQVEVFQGDYIGVDPYDETDTIDLNDGYEENADGSAPSFHYVLQDVITVEEM